MSEFERIIPIKIEKGESSSHEVSSTSETNKDCQKKDTLQSASQQTKPHVQIKPLNESKSYEYLKKYYVFEERGKDPIVNINVPEKIILVIDRAQDEHCSNFIAKNIKYTPMTMLRKSLHLFVKLKSMINKNHEFAIVLLNENNASWYMNFTSDVRRIDNAIGTITQCEVEDTFDISLVFEEIIPNIKVPEETVAPPYIIRTVLFYGRSYTVPELKFSEDIQALLDHSFFIFDVLMTHEPIDKSNHCSKIFERLQNIDKKGISYFFPVGRNTRRLHNSIAKLLGHGLQRPLQKLQKI
ncbi:BRISC and BRCA1-A complex member 1-like [Diorhabda sublineata]|uniref:BRISC and BRCA1-A complex member 1-like n=1 Tax=Diorhabda sublineata TaxID=1163346 RepID=UPI0024E088F5|nr:BRISC and BRCA1-A complex member 1-like [Diorhabda sublineata]